MGSEQACVHTFPAGKNPPETRTKPISPSNETAAVSKNPSERLGCRTALCRCGARGHPPAPRCLQAPAALSVASPFALLLPLRLVKKPAPPPPRPRLQSSQPARSSKSIGAGALPHELPASRLVVLPCPLPLLGRLRPAAVTSARRALGSRPQPPRATTSPAPESKILSSLFPRSGSSAYPELRGFRGSNGYLAAAARADLRSSAWGDQIGARLGALQLNSARGSSRRQRRWRTLAWRAAQVRFPSPWLLPSLLSGMLPFFFCFLGLCCFG